MNPWPEAGLDPVARLRILAAALPHVAWTETVVAAPFHDVWSLLGDLEGGAPQYETGLQTVLEFEREGERRKVRARGRFGAAMELDVELRPGWCLMSSGSFVIGMAAVSAKDGGTRIAHFEGIAGLGRLLRPLLRWKVRRELKVVAKLVRAESQSA